MLQDMNANDNRELTGYDAINALWGQDVHTLRKPTDKEAVKACRLLIAEGFRAFGDGLKPSKYKFILTSGRRHTWRRYKSFFVNPDYRGQGFTGIVHSVSHFVHSRCHTKWRGHEGHLIVERHLIEFVIKRRWIEDGLKVRQSTKQPVPIKDLRKSRIEKRLKLWFTKQKRATTAISKLQKQLKRYA